LGLAIAGRRVRRLDLDRALGERLAWWALIGGLLGAHLFWYEFLYLSLVVPVILLLGRRARAPGFFLGTFVPLYMPVRFGLDFLRIADARYGGLTPAQWLASAAWLGALAIILARRRTWKEV
jgi:prolipoprotein diacylglyceryltransferase